MKQQGYIIDLDGTLYRGNERLPYAAEFITALRQSGAPHVLMTNNSMRTPQEVAAHLNRLGIPAGPEDVLTSAQATVRYLDSLGGRRNVYCIGEGGLTAALEEAGYTLTDRGADCVVVGLNRAFDYAMLKTAMELILAGARFVLTNPDVRLPTEGGFLPGAGSLGKAIETASGASPVVIGKPSAIITGFALDMIGLPPSDVWMVGDNMRTDMQAGKNASCRTALLLTGITDAASLPALAEETGITCDFVGEHLGAFMDHIGLPAAAPASADGDA